MSSFGPPAVPRAGSDRLTAGNLGALGLSDIVQILVLGRKTGCVTLNSEAGEGRIWFRDGAAVHATCGELDGESAFCALVGWNDGTFLIEHESTCAKATIDNDTMLLVMEGLRQVDEGRLAEPDERTDERQATATGLRRRGRPARRYVLGGAVSLIGLAVVVLALAMRAPREASKNRAPLVQDDVKLARAHPPFDGRFPAEPLEPTAAEVGDAPVGAPVPKPKPSLPSTDPEPLAEAAPPETESLPPPEEFGPPPPPPSTLDLVVKGKLKGGSLELLVDGEPVFAIDPESAGSKGRLAESGVVELPHGEYELTARLTDARQRRYEKRAVVSVVAGERRTVRLVAGRMLGAPLTLKVLEGEPPSPD